MIIFTTGYPAGYDPDEELEASVGMECELPDGKIAHHIYWGYSLNEALSEFCSRFGIDSDEAEVEREEDLPSIIELMVAASRPARA